MYVMWNGMEWNGMERNGTKWNGTEWNVMTECLFGSPPNVAKAKDARRFQRKLLCLFFLGVFRLPFLSLVLPLLSII